MKLPNLFSRRMQPWGAAAIALVLGVLAFELFSTWGVPYMQQLQRANALKDCTSKVGEDQIECIFRIISSEIKARGVGAALEVFSQAYEISEPFVAGGCHRQAHRLGDLAYYGSYLGKEDLAAMEFPQSTTACGYGFYHGFLEHLIQDHPDPAFVDRTCMYLNKRLSGTMGDIRLTCYHGSGHGFVLAQIEKLKTSDWGNLRKFSDHPIELCSQLKDASSVDREQCYEGIFNVLVDAMSDKAYGFSYNYEHPFLACDALPKFEWRSCYYEMAQKLDKPSHFSPIKLAALASQGAALELRRLAFRVGIAGIIQQVIADGDRYKEILEECGALPDDLYQSCLGSVINGLYEHGNPQKEYIKALAACGDPSVGAHQLSRKCYSVVAARLPRFYTDEKITLICKEFPDAYRSLCEAEKGKHSAESGNFR